MRTPPPYCIGEASVDWGSGVVNSGADRNLVVYTNVEMCSVAKARFVNLANDDFWVSSENVGHWNAST
jgi:hypothetical protein